MTTVLTIAGKSPGFRWIARELVEAASHPALFQFLNAWCPLKVSPRSASANISDRVDLHPETGCNLTCGFIEEVKTPDFPNHRFGERCIWFLFSQRAGGIQFGNPLRIIEQTRRGYVALAFNGIVDVVLLRSPTNVLRIAAGRVVAGMKGAGFWERSGAIDDMAGYPRRSDFHAPGFTVSQREKTVSVPMSRSGNPGPAFVFSADFNFSPKSTDILLSQIHVLAPFASARSTIPHTRRIVKW